MKINAAILAGLLTFASSASAMKVVLVPDTAPNAIPLGANFVVDVVGEEFAGGLDGGGFHILFDPDVVNITGFGVDGAFEFSTGTLGFPLADPVNPPDVSAPRDLQNRVQLGGIAFNTFAIFPPAGDFPIASLSFVATRLGTTVLQLQEFGGNPFAVGGLPVAGLELGNLEVTVVPIPAAILLLMGGLTSLLVLRRR